MSTQTLPAMMNVLSEPSQDPYAKALVQETIAKRKTASEILEQLQQMEKEKFETIGALLMERDELQKNTQIRLDKIASALKLLGYKKKRGPRKSKDLSQNALTAPAKRKRS